MKNHDIDDELRAALRAEDAELLASLERDPGFKDVLQGAFGGRLAWLMAVVSFWQIVFFGLAVWTAVRFFGAESAEDLAFWGICMLAAWLSTAMLKLMAWMQIGRNLVLREIKRVELQVATLGARRRD